MSNSPALSNAPVVQNPAIDIIDIVKIYSDGAVRALDGVSMQIAKGEFVAITGPSGCGKSTLLHLMAALDTPTSGVVKVNGNDLSRIKDLSHYRRNEVGLIFQLHNLLPQLSALGNVQIAMQHRTIRGMSRSEHAHQLLEELGLAGVENRQPSQLSGGERQRVAIARALANDPQVLLADEPTGSLDSASVQNLMEIFARLRSEHETTIVLVTHDLEVASAADRTVFMRDGHIVDQGTASVDQGTASVDQGTAT